KPVALLCVRAQPVYARRGAGAVRALHPDQLDLARGRLWMHGPVHGRRHPRLRSVARIARAARRAVRYAPPLVAAAAVIAVAATAHAADPRFPDWPCNQIKVPEISVAAVWSGPSIDDVGDAWEQDPVIRDLVARLAARRTPLEEAQKLISDYIAGSADERR